MPPVAASEPKDVVVGDNASDLAVLARGGSLSFVGSAFGAALSMALLLVITWGLGPDDGGALFEAIALFNIVIVTATLGADTGLLRFTARYLALGEPGEVRRLLAVGLVPVAVVGLAAAAAGVALSGTIGDWLGGASHADLVQTFAAVLAVFVPIGALNLAVMGATRGYGTMVPTVLAERIGRPAAQLLLVFIAVAVGAGAAIIAGAWGVAFVGSLTAGLLWLRVLGKRNGVPTAPASHRPIGTVIREFWSFSLPRAFASMFRVGVLWLDVLLVGALISPRAAAVYTVATRLLQAGFLAVDAIGQAVEPMFSSLLAAGHRTRANSLFQVSTGWLVGLTWPLFLTAWIFAEPVLGLFGPEFPEATSVIAILAGSALIGSGFGTVDVLLVMAGKSMWSFWNSATALTLNVVLNLVLIPELGLNGAALAWAVSRIVANVLPLIQIHSLLGFLPFGIGWRTAAIASLGTFGVIGLVMRAAFGSGLLVLLAYLVVAGACYLGLVWRWRDRLDIAAFRTMLQRSIGQPTEETS